MPDYRQVARQKAQKYGIDPNIFERQINQESGFQTRARSGAGAQGIAQIMPATARGWGVDPNDPDAALDAAAKNMAGYIKRYGGWENALRAYNAGPGAIQASKGYSETNKYVSNIMGGQTPRNPAPSGGGSSSEPTASTPSAAPTTPQAGGIGQKKIAALAQLIASTGSTKDNPLFQTGVLSLTGESTAPASAGTATGTTGTPARGGRTLVVGDSLGVGTAPYLEKDIGGVTADVKVGRPSSNAVSILRQKLAGGNYGRIVFDVGTNDGSAQQLAQSLRQAQRLAPNAEIYVPTVRGPGAAQKNKVIRQMAGGNLHVVDWAGQATGLGGDGVHATAQGYRSRAELIAGAMGGSSLGSSGQGGSSEVRGNNRYAAGELQELFYNGPGGVNADEGKEVPRGFVSGHTDHVHVAAGPQRVKQLARLAQQMGLTVRELEPFDKVDPVHTTNSFHYSGRAADVSGDPSKMAAYSRRVARMFGIR